MKGKIKAALAATAIALLGLTAFSCAGRGSSPGGWKRTPVDRAMEVWAGFEMADTSAVNSPEQGEQRFADFAAALRGLSLEERREAADSLSTLTLADATFTAYGRLLWWAEHYLYDGNSPLRDDEMYLPFVETFINDPRTPEAERERLDYRLGLLQKNRPGAQAEDFAFTLADGQTGRLYSLPKRPTLLFFYNPGCPECRKSREFLTASGTLSQMIADGRLNVLAVYPDEEMDQWRGHLSEMPQDWTVASDPQGRLREDDLYDLKAIPCLYLLDAHRRVVLKDATAEQMLAAIISE